MSTTYYLDNVSQLERVARRANYNGAWLLKPNLQLHINGDIEFDVPLKLYGSSVITGEAGSVLRFTGKGGITTASDTRSVTVSNITLIGEERGIFTFGQNTARSLKLHNVIVDAKQLGAVSVTSLAMSQVSFLNEEMEPLVMGQHLDTLIMSSVRHDGKNCVLDLTRTSLDGIGLITEAYVKHADSGLILLNDHADPERTNRYNFTPSSFILKNIQGLNRDIDVFRTRDTVGNLRGLEHNVIKPYVI